MTTSRPPVDWPDSPVRDLVLQLIGQEPLETFFELRQTRVIRMLKEDDQPVVEVPTAQPIVEEPPEVEVPEPGGERELPEPPGEGEGGGLQDICGSVVGAGGIVLLPGFYALRRRRRA